MGNTDPLSFSECDLLRRLHDDHRLFAELRDAGEAELALQKRLRDMYPPELVRAAITLHELRRKARLKFTRADDMWLDRVGLEQATSETVARYKARRFQGWVTDLCCGIGGDAVALAERSAVVAVDLNPAACLRTRYNAEAYGVAAQVHPVCTRAEAFPIRTPLVHIDPDRRAGRSGRSLRLQDVSPSLEFLQELIRTADGGAIKLSPASNFAGQFPGMEIELISSSGECKEATVWFGSLAGDLPARATILPSGDSLAGDPLQTWTETGPLQRFIYDPDPSIVRAGLIDLLAERTDLRRLDAAEEYLTAEEVVSSPFATAFEVVEDLPNNQRQIRRFFRDMPFGQLEIKCRHIPTDAEAVRRKLPLTGDRPGVLIFARIDGRARAIVCRRVPTDG